jgi:hypothetical protein
MDDAGRVRDGAYPTDDAGIKRALPRFNPLAHPSVMYRKRVVLEAGGYRYRRYPACEDYELWSRMARSGKRFANHPAPLLRYRIHPGAMKTTHLRGILRGVREVKQMHWVDQMDWRGRLRMCGERGLLWLPPSVALRLFVWSQYRRRRPTFASHQA